MGNRRAKRAKIFLAFVLPKIWGFENFNGHFTKESAKQKLQSNDQPKTVGQPLYTPDLTLYLLGWPLSKLSGFSLLFSWLDHILSGYYVWVSMTTPNKPATLHLNVVVLLSMLSGTCCRCTWCIRVLIDINQVDLWTWWILLWPTGTISLLL